MKNTRKLNLKEAGITLVALVVTIIVLLILAGISISMLSGDNSILQKATDAKTETEKGQEKEIVALAYNSALAKKVGNGNSTEVTAEDLNAELTNQGASAKGSNPITVTFTESKRQYTINTNGEITYAGIKNKEDSNIQLSITANETESRAVILKVTAISSEGEENTLTEAKLQELEETNPEEVQDMFVEAYKTLMAGKIQEQYLNTMTWSSFNAESVASLNNDANFINFATSMGYSNAYDLITQNYGSGIEAIFTCDGNDSITGISAEFIVTNPNPTITATAVSDGSYAEQVWSEYPNTKKETYSEIQDSNYTLTQDGYTAVVPAGFAYGTSTNIGTISNGIVITDSVDENGYSNGNEFVWIPVTYNSTTGKITITGTDKEIAKLQDGSDTNYRGVLYDWNSNSAGNTTYSWSSTSTDTREPAYLNHTYDGDVNNTVGITQELLQNEYNSMIASIKVHGGFYVARYEMGKDSFSKLGVLPLTTNESNWYELYSKAKTYINPNTDNIIINSSMIWGSQYDAMINFGLTNSTDSIKINATTNGNHTGTLLKTGMHKGTDSINNIFDLEGNLQEWTLEAYNDNGRVIRGGGYTYLTTYAPNKRQSTRPKIAFPTGSSRIVLYIK